MKLLSLAIYAARRISVPTQVNETASSSPRLRTSFDSRLRAIALVLAITTANTWNASAASVEDAHASLPFPIPEIPTVKVAHGNVDTAKDYYTRILAELGLPGAPAS